MIEKKDVSRLKEGTMPLAMGNNPFIVMREHIKLKRTDNIDYQWSITDSPKEKDALVISKEDASEIIDNFGMEMSHSVPEGKIFELPGRPFYERFNNRERIHKNRAS